MDRTPEQLRNGSVASQIYSWATDVLCVAVECGKQYEGGIVVDSMIPAYIQAQQTLDMTVGEIVKLANGDVFR